MFFYLFTVILLVSLPCPVYSSREKCCEDAGVPEHCSKFFCNPSEIKKGTSWTFLEREGSNCTEHFLKISLCTTQRRDATRCCYKNTEKARRDECFGMANGTETKKDGWGYERTLRYCLMETADEIFSCIVNSWTNSPTPPRNLRVVSKTEDSALIKWETPEELPELVDHYRIQMFERTENKAIEKIYTTEETEFKLDGLSKNYTYIMYVTAIASRFNETDDWYKSQRSNLASVTLNDPVKLSTSEIRTPPVTENLTMHCTLKSIKEASPDVDWIKVNENESVLLEDGDKYSVVSYIPKEKRDAVFSALRISGFENETDFGTYHCYAKDTRFEYGEVNVTEYVFSEQAPEDAPPETSLECCTKTIRPHDPRCYSVCYKAAEPKGNWLNPGAFYPPPRWCQTQINQVYNCSMKTFNTAACCIHKKVPLPCLGLCDNSYSWDKNQVKFCKKELSSVYSCKLEKLSVRPEPVTDVVQSLTVFFKFRFDWKPSVDAGVYHVYIRHYGYPWEVYVTLDTSFEVFSTDEFAVLAVNEFGYSEAFRMARVNRNWIEVDHW